ncbi:MAG: hypothetical protein JOY82_06970 [Streptosporangiaceae bacterium]|nr:hypothetical protein [Streptosporangiaceae bacterium]MBV9854255.1 hypothetical protein [Streptosporangiaceae bacterium]
MRSVTHHLSISAVRADALFVSPLQRSETPGPAQVRQAIATAVRTFGSRGCAAQVAQEYGEHPETAVARMRWARAAIAGTFGRPNAGPCGTPGAGYTASRVTRAA